VLCSLCLRSRTTFISSSISTTVPVDSVFLFFKSIRGLLISTRLLLSSPLSYPISKGKLDKAIEVFSTLLQYRTDLPAAHLGTGKRYIRLHCAAQHCHCRLRVLCDLCFLFRLTTITCCTIISHVHLFFLFLRLCFRVFRTVIYYAVTYLIYHSFPHCLSSTPLPCPPFLSPTHIRTCPHDLSHPPTQGVRTP
jgi:hypothetical protein